MLKSLCVCSCHSPSLLKSLCACVWLSQSVLISLCACGLITQSLLNSLCACCLTTQSSNKTFGKPVYLCSVTTVSVGLPVCLCLSPCPQCQPAGSLASGQTCTGSEYRLGRLLRTGESDAVSCQAVLSGSCQDPSCSHMPIDLPRRYGEHHSMLTPLLVFVMAIANR